MRQLKEAALDLSF